MELTNRMRRRVYRATRAAYEKYHEQPDCEQLVADEIKTEFASILAAFLLNLAIQLAVSFVKSWIIKKLTPTQLPLELEEDENGEA